ncbi:hypothetical protein [Pseudanabaena sp. BC1403]|uniref:hypothetical protein n=1 Tax=Pseudanabaena sp. BC1403 TaxID=2043171 RepID=UPI000CD86672|nr:hypothetical protein [Pseudanabaena sp. BC1403]
MTLIDDAMRNLFIETYKLYELEKQFNYQNYGKYPYRDRKNSVQIIADFNVDAYSVNGLFVTEESYLQYYPPEIIETVESVLVESRYVSQVFEQSVEIVQGDQGQIDEITLQTAYGSILAYERYENIVVREFVEVEAVEVQTMRYLFPFNCVPDSLGRLVLSF